MDKLQKYSKEGALAGGSSGLVNGAWAGISVYIILSFIMPSEPASFSFGAIIESIFGFSVQGGITGLILGIILGLGFLVLQNHTRLKNDRKSVLKYSMGIFIFLSFLGGLRALGIYWNYNVDNVITLGPSLGTTTIVAIALTGVLYNLLFVYLWGHWFGKSIEADE